MTFTGKLLIVLIMLMSITFMAFAVMVYTTHRNWKELVDNQEQGKPRGVLHQLADRVKEITDLENQIDRLEQAGKVEKDAKIQQIAQLETRISTLQELVKQLQGEKATLVQTERESAAAVQAIQTSLAEKRKEVAAVRKELLEVHRARDEFFASVVKLRDEVNMATGELDRLKTRRDQMAEQITGLQRLLAYLGESEHTVENRATPPRRVEGRIVSLNSAEKLVEISLGSDDGILKGHVLEVFRLANTPRYLGRVQVLRAEPDRAVAVIVPGTQQGAFERDDHVATQLR